MRLSDAIRTSAGQLSSEVFAAGGGIPAEVISASGIISACATLLYKQSLLWERTVDSLTAAEQELASARLASAAATKVALPGLRTRTTSNAGSAAGAAPKQPSASGSQTPVALEANAVQQQQAAAAALQARAADMMQQVVPQQQQAGSTESEDEERHVVPLSLVKLPPSGNRGDEDVESDAASVRSASTLELLASGAQLPALRRARPS